MRGLKIAVFFSFSVYDLQIATLFSFALFTKHQYILISQRVVNRSFMYCVVNLRIHGTSKSRNVDSGVKSAMQSWGRKSKSNRVRNIET